MVGIRSDGIRVVVESRLIIVGWVIVGIARSRSGSANSDDSFVDVTLEISISMISRKRPAANNVGLTYSKEENFGTKKKGNKIHTPLRQNEWIGSLSR